MKRPRKVQLPGIRASSEPNWRKDLRRRRAKPTPSKRSSILSSSNLLRT